MGRLLLLFTLLPLPVCANPMMMRKCGSAMAAFVSSTFERIGHPSAPTERMSRAAWVTVNGERKIFKTGPLITEQHMNNEIAAYAVAEKLGMHRVPKAEKAIINGETGVLIDPKPGIDIEQMPAGTHEAIGLRRAFAEADFFDYLIANGDRTTDRDPNNLLIVVDQAGNPVDANLIDHHICFRDATKPNRPRRKPAGLVAKLREVPESEWRILLEDLIPEPEIDKFLERRAVLIR